MQLATLFAFVVALLFSTTAYAGINVEQRRADTEHEGVFGDVVLSGNLAYGNANVLALTGGGLVGWRNNKNVVFGLASASFGSDLNDNRFMNKQMGHLRYNRRLVRWLWWEVFTQAEHDQFLLLKLRALGGTGPRFHLLDAKVSKTTVDIFYGTSYMPEYESLDDRVLINPPPSQANTFVHRWNNYLTVVINPTESVKLQSTIYYQPQFAKFLDFRVMNDNSLSIELTDRLELDLMASLRYDSLPATFCSSGPASACAPDEIASLKRLDLTTSTAFSFEF